MLSFAEVAIIAATLQAILTGLQFATSLLCLRWQIYSDDGLSTRKNIQWPMLIITLVAMAFCLIGLGSTMQTVLVGLNGDNYIPTSLIAVCDLTAQNCRYFSGLASVHTCREGFAGNYYRWCYGSWIEVLAESCLPPLSGLPLLGGVQQIVAHYSLPCSLITIHLLVHSHQHLLDCGCRCKSAGYTINTSIF